MLLNAFVFMIFIVYYLGIFSSNTVRINQLVRFIIVSFLTMGLSYLTFITHIKRYLPKEYGLYDYNKAYTKADYYRILKYQNRTELEYELLCKLPLS